MGSEKEDRAGIVEAACRHAGTWVGTASALSKKIAGVGAWGVSTMKRVVVGRFGGEAVPAAVEVFGPAPEVSGARPGKEKVTAGKNASKAPAEALRLDLAAARLEVKEARSVAEKAKSELVSKLTALQAQRESLISELDQARSAADDAELRKDALKARVAAQESDLATVREELEEAHRTKKNTGIETLSSDVSAVRTEKLQSRLRVAEAEVAGPSDVTLEDVRSAVFSNPSERIIFTKALSDISSRDPAVRASAVKALADIRHELSVRALVAQMGRETSSHVRQECIKGLTSLGMKEGLPAVMRALMDENALVRLAAVWGLYRLCGTASARGLTHMFSDENEEVRRRAATCLGWLGQEELAVDLLPLLADSSVSVRRAAVAAMGTLRSRQVVSALIERLNDSEESIRRAALDAIEKITGKKMSKSFPMDEKSHRRLVARWQEWWKEEQPG